MLYKKARLTEKERKVLEDREKIWEAGQQSEEKAQRVIRTLFRQKELEEADQRAVYLTKLHSRKAKNDYNQILAKITVGYLREEDLERDVGFKVFFDIKGVIMYIFYKGRIFQRAFRSVREPHIDLNACKMFAISASSLVGKLKHGPSTFAR